MNKNTIITTLLDIWGTWCGPCKAALKDSHKLKEALKDYDMK